MTAVQEKLSVNYDAAHGRESVVFDDGLDANLFVTSSSGEKRAYQITPAPGPPQPKMVCATTGINIGGGMYNAIPDVADFEFAGTETVDGVTANVFTLHNPPKDFPTATSNYTFYADAATDAPLKYEYIGFYSNRDFDTGFLNSPNYDWFVVYFSNYKANYVNASAFDIPEVCQDANVHHHPSTVTPDHIASRFQPHLGADHHTMFRHFKAAHGKKYSESSEEHAARFGHFKYNLATVHRLNNEHETSRYNLNHMGDLSDSEISSMKMPPQKRGLTPDSDIYVPKTSSIDELPESVNWRARGAVGPAREQLNCGSCWTFGSAGAVETAVHLSRNGFKPGNLMSIPDEKFLAALGPKVGESAVVTPESDEFLIYSEQQIVSCDSASAGCNGGTAKSAYDYIKSAGGLALARDYPYLGQDGVCHKATPNVTLSGHKDLLPFDQHAVLDAIANHGVLAAAVDTASPVWTWFNSGIANIPHCNPSPDSLDHEIQLVGYDSKALYIKNSWSSWYGTSYVGPWKNPVGPADGGYIAIAIDNACGAYTSAVLPIIAE